MPEIVSLKEAVRLGLNRYFTGKPCKSGHVAERRVDSYHCAECASLASVASAKKDIVRRRKNSAAYRRMHPAKKQGYRLRTKYGISMEERDRMFEIQGKCCAVCQSDDPGSYGRWNIDHCHGTGSVRGILCQACNLALGFARDSVPVLQSMVAYLQRHSQVAQQGADVVKTVADAHASTHAGNVDRAAAAQQVPA